MFPIITYGAPLPYFDPTCPQCLQEQQALVFNSKTIKTASSLNPLAKEFVPGQGLGPRAGTSDHDSVSTRHETPVISDFDAFPPLPSVRTSKGEAESELTPDHGTSCKISFRQTTEPDNSDQKPSGKSNEQDKTTTTPAQTPKEPASPENTTRQVTTAVTKTKVKVTSPEEKPLQTAAPKPNTLPDTPVVQAIPLVPTEEKVKVPEKNAALKTCGKRITLSLGLK